MGNRIDRIVETYRERMKAVRALTSLAFEYGIPLERINKCLEKGGFDTLNEEEIKKIHEMEER